MKKIIGISSICLFLLAGCDFANTSSSRPSVVVDKLELNGVYKTSGSALKVSYKGEQDPFNYEGNKFAYLLINDSEASVAYLGKHADRYFEFLPEKADETKFTFEWFNSNNEKYLYALSDGVKEEGEDPDEGPAVVSIEVVSPKTVYRQYDEFIKPTVYAHYDDSSTRNVTSLATFTGFDSSSLGLKTVTVSYKDKTKTFEVTIIHDDHSTPVIPEGYSTIALSEEFGQESINEELWSFQIGTGDGGWGNGEAQYYTKENAHLENGKLHISAKKENKETSEYTSSRMITKSKFSFKYGYVEARIALPTITGMWPAFWMMPQGDAYGGWPHSGEIDIIEARGRVPYISSSAIHFSNLSWQHNYLTSEHTKDEPISEYHIYACEWKKETISFFVDDEKYFETRYTDWSTAGAPSNEYAPFDQSFYIILNLAVGGHFDGYKLPPEGFTSADMIVDYVRVYQ